MQHHWRPSAWAELKYKQIQSMIPGDLKNINTQCCISYLLILHVLTKNVLLFVLKHIRSSLRKYFSSTLGRVIRVSNFTGVLVGIKCCNTKGHFGNFRHFLIDLCSVVFISILIEHVRNSRLKNKMRNWIPIEIICISCTYVDG